MGITDRFKKDSAGSIIGKKEIEIRLKVDLRRPQHVSGTTAFGASAP
jgi:hypothetical protein